MTTHANRPTLFVCLKDKTVDFCS